MEHGFVKALYKRCRLNSKKLEESEHIETKKNSGAKVTEAQLEKLSKKSQYKSEIAADLDTLELFI